MRGVPKDSVLGLVLFKIFINDLDQGTQDSLNIFTDDTKLGVVAFRRNLQEDLYKMENWAEIGLPFPRFPRAFQGS